MGSSKKQTVGYWYSMGLHMGLCLGPIDALLEIRAGDRTAWSGTLTSSGQIMINAEKLFGGKKREGGIVGALDVMMGESTQLANDYLTSKQGTPQPAYRGFTGLVFRGGKITANNPYIKPWAVKVLRVVSGWDTPVWYAEKASIDVGGGLVAMNPAHIIYECLTNREWGLGYPTATIDAASFAAAADTLYSEGFGLCMQWTQQDSIQSFLQIVTDHIGAGCGEDPRTGLWVLKLIRGGYDINALPEFSDAAGNIISLESYDRSTGEESFNELTVIYTDPLTGKDGSITVHQLAAIQAYGAIIPQTRNYPGLPTMDLAARIAQRDIVSGTSCLARVRLVVNRTAYGVQPGDVLKFAWAPLGIAAMAIRVGRVDYGSHQRGEITIEAVEDVFGLPAASYIKPSSTGWTEPDRSPQPSTAVAAFEVPYRELVASIGAAEAQEVPADSGYLATVARRPSGLSINYELRTRVGAAAYAQVDDAEWTPTGTLTTGIGPTSTLLTLSGAEDLDLVEVGGACTIGAGATAEIVRVDAVDLGAGTVTVGRGCCDTVPRTWTTGTRVWFHDAFAGTDPTEYAVTETVDAKIVTRTTGGELDESLAPVASATMARRAARPYPPADLKINGLRYPAEEYNALTATWVHRDRILQQDTLIDHVDAGIGPEAGTTYTATWYLDGVLVRTQTGITGTSDAYTPPASSGGKPVVVEIEAVRAGLASWQRATHTFTYRAQRISEAGDRRVTEAGDARTLE